MLEMYQKTINKVEFVVRFFFSFLKAIRLLYIELVR